MKVDWQRFREVISCAENIVLTSHIRPDCDALGSCLGLAGVLRTLGKRVRIVCGQPTPPNLTFIDPDHQILTIHQDIGPEEIADADLQVIVDTSAWAQLGPMADVIRNSTCKRIIFDHHVGEDDMNAELFKETRAEAAGRMVVDAARELGVELDAEIAQALFAALATDTGWFRFSSVNEKTFEAAASLLRAGAVPAEVYGHLYERETLGRVRLRGLVLTRIELELEGRLTHTYILAEDYQATGALPSDTEDLVNLALEIEGTEFAVILVGLITGGFKVSFRSRCSVACNEVAKRFGGGGHQAAAGAFVNQDLATTREQVLGHVREFMENA
jgi:phosphoesterase RecJ-like protein